MEGITGTGRMAQASVAESSVALPPVNRERIMTSRKIPLELFTTPATVFFGRSEAD